MVFGNDYPAPDGTGVRDYIHVMDLADAHVAALRRLFDASGSFTANLGSGQGHSVLELIRAYEQASGRSIPYEFSPRRTRRCRRVLRGPSPCDTVARLVRAARSAGHVCRQLALAADEP